MRSPWKRLGVKSLIGKSQPGQTLQRSLTYTLILRGIWAQCVVVHGYVFFEARSLIDMHLLGKRSSKLFTRSLAEVILVLRRGEIFFRCPSLSRVITLIFPGEGSLETLICAIGYSSTSFLIDVCRCECSLEHIVYFG